METQPPTPPPLPYFPRPALTREIFKIAESGLTNGVTMFAPRRLGKTWFVTHELLDAFRNRGWAAYSIDLWLRSSDVGAGLVELLEEAPKGRRSGWTLEQLKLKLGTRGTGAEGTMAHVDSNLDARLDAALARFTRRGSPPRTLLVFDEFQSLAKVPHQQLVRTLRAGLQKYQGRIFPVFTGSSRGALNAMFKSAKAPFFQSAVRVKFPALERDFIVDRIKLLHARSPRRHPLRFDADEFYARFQWLGGSPLFANELVLRALLDLSGDFEAVYNHWLLVRADQEEYAKQFTELKPIHQTILRVLAEFAADGASVRGAYSEESIAAMQRFAPKLAISPPGIQSALRTLIAHQLVAEEDGKGQYTVEDPAFRAYLLKTVPLVAGLAALSSHL